METDIPLVNLKGTAIRYVIRLKASERKYKSEFIGDVRAYGALLERICDINDIPLKHETVKETDVL